MAPNAAIEAAIREAQLDAAIAEVTDGNLSGEAIIAHANHDEASTETFVEDRRNADAVTVYSQLDGVASDILVSMLSKQLRKRFPRSPNIPQNLWGKLAFKMAPPPGLVELPKLKCWLHVDHPKREGLNAIGLGHRTCMKSNMPSEMDVRMHMQRKHPQENKMITENATAVTEAEDRALRREEVTAMQELAARAFTVAGAPVDPTPTKSPAKSAEKEN